MNLFLDYLKYTIYKVGYRYARAKVLPEKGAEYNFGSIIFFLASILILITLMLLDIKLSISIMIFAPILFSIIGGWVSEFIFDFSAIKEIKLTEKELKSQRVVLLIIILLLSLLIIIYNR